MIPGDNLFSYAIQAADALAARGVVVTESATAFDIDLRSFGEVEVFGSESGAYFRFKSGRGDIRVILAASAFFTLQNTFRRTM